MKFPNPITALKALFRFSKRPELVPQDVEDARTECCDRCEHSSGNQCQKCTCYIPLKVKLSTESCPIKKWGQYHYQKFNGLT